VAITADLGTLQRLPAIVGWAPRPKGGPAAGVGWGQEGRRGGAPASVLPGPQDA
jgi:hypothetical protein